MCMCIWGSLILDVKVNVVNACSQSLAQTYFDYHRLAF